MNYIDHVYYINLDHRIDRNLLMKKELEMMKIDPNKVTRVSAIRTKGFGILGCGLTHKFILEQFLMSPYRNCLILEDDFKFLYQSEIVEECIEKVFKNNVDFDIIMLSGNVFLSEVSPWSFLRRVIDAQTTSGYLISKKFASVLLQSFSESTSLLEDHYKRTKTKKYEFCLDIYWKKLQPYSKWFIINPKLGFQRESFSDIENKVTNYKV